MPQKPKILQAEFVAQSRIFRVEALSLEFSNGEQRIFERLVSKHPAVLIVPIIENSHFMLIREYSAGLDKYELTFPKGLVEPNESILAGADRELREETGYGARQLTELRELSIIPSYMTHKTTLVLAQDLYAAPLMGDEPEPIETVTWALDDVDNLLSHPDFSEGRCFAALWLALRYLKKEL